VGKSQIKKHRYIIKKTRTKKEKIINRINWTGLGLYWTSHKAGLSPAAWAGLMFQPAATMDWLLCMSTITS
jgi:hypothetical protein